MGGLIPSLLETRAMTAADPRPRTVPPLLADDANDLDDAEESLGDSLDVSEPSATDELSEETGIDLSDASELDADNVPADEEHDRIMQAPD